MKKEIRHKILSATVLLTIFMIPLSFSMFNLFQGTLYNGTGDFTENGNNNELPLGDYTPKSSDTFYTDTEYDLSMWWDTRFRYRVAIELEEVEGIDRYEPVEAFLLFENYEHYAGSARLVSFNATGLDEWSSELPVQVWNVTYYTSPYVQSCTVTFLAEVSANSNQTYFLYYNEDLTNIGLPSYDTNFTSTLAGGKLTVTVGDSGDIYEAVLEVGKGVSELNKDSNNFHLDESLSPEKQLADPNLKFLAHMDEGFGLYVNDSTGNVSPGVLTNLPTWTDGIVRNGLDFEQSSNQFVNFGAALEDPGDPFDGLSTEFTITAWIKPESISSTQRSNHYTYNCFMAKASDPYNDNFEIGVNNDGRIHVYIDTESKDTQADFGDSINNPIVVGAWNFIALRYDSGSVEVRINDNWYSSNAWSGATDLDEADGSLFTIGSTDHTNTYFDGVIDEVAIYNIALSHEEVEAYKYGSETSTIQTIRELENGAVFSRYEVNWTESFDMHASDIVTFYYGYNLWSIKRSIYFDSEFDGELTTSQMSALNTYYDLSGLTQNDQFYYFYDGVLVKGLENDGFTVENYTIIHDTIHASTKNTLGIFVAAFFASGDAFSEITYLQGTVNYDASTDTVRYNPGSINDFKNNANPNNKLNIEFWEFIDHINHTAYTPKLNDSEMTQLFEDQYTALKNPLDLYIYEREGAFYNIEVTVTDIDDNPVPEATVQLWNASDYSMTWTEYTDESGVALFTRLENGTYIANATYEKYGQPALTITTPKILEINENTVDSSGLNQTSFTNVQLTSLNLTLNRVTDAGIFQEYLEGAEVSFEVDSGSGNQFIGSEYANEMGNVVFRWQNFTTPSDGNVTFSIIWFVTSPTNVTAVGDLDGEDVVNTNVTFYFFAENSSNVNCVFGNTFDSNLDFTVYPDPDFNQMLGSTLYFQVNFTYIQDGTIVNPVLGATVTYDIKSGTSNINTQTLYFFEIGGGLYNLTINTANPVETGGANWLSENDYLIEVHAFKAGFISGDGSTSFILDPRTSNLIANETELTAYYGEMLVLEVVYTDVSFGGSISIDGATVEYSVIGVPTVVGSLTPFGTGGRYLFSLETTEFPISDSYIVQISASKQNYVEKSVFIDINILAIKSLINESVGIYETMDIAFREEQLFYFTYTEESSSLGLAACDIHTYEWTKEIGDVVVGSGAGSLGEVGSGIYSLDFDTETLEIATYTIIFTLEKENYAPRGGILILNIIPREFNVILDSKFSGNIISTVSGEGLGFEIELVDEINGTHIEGANVQITVGGQIIYGSEISNGIYSFSLSGTDLPDAFFLPQTISALISMDKTFYYSEERTISIVVGMVEIFPGFPMFYFLIIVIGIAAIAGSLVTYRQIQRARIPTFVKKVREMSKNIKGRKSVSESLLYPTKEEYIIKKLGDKWEMLGLSLEEIYGLEGKKRKKLPETPESEGGVM